MGRSDGTHSMNNEGGGKITIKAEWISVPCIFSYFWVQTKNLRLQEDHTHLSGLKLLDHLSIQSIEIHIPDFLIKTAGGSGLRKQH